SARSDRRVVLDRHALHAISALELVHHVHSLRHPAENGVNAIKVPRIRLAQHDEELAPAGIPPRVRHRKGPELVGPGVVLRLALDAVTRTARAYARVRERVLL